MSAPEFALEDDERIIHRTHRHWVNIMPVLLGSAFVVGAVVIFSFWLGASGTVNGLMPASLLSGGLVLMVALVALIVLGGLWVYGQNQVILTNQHLVQITQIGLFNRTVSQLSLAKVQDVTSSKHGLIPTLLDYGDITIETAGEEQNFVFKQVPAPHVLCGEIMKAHEALEQGGQAGV